MKLIRQIRFLLIALLVVLAGCSTTLQTGAKSGPTASTTTPAKSPPPPRSPPPPPEVKTAPQRLPATTALMAPPPTPPSPPPPPVSEMSSNAVPAAARIAGTGTPTRIAPPRWNWPGPVGRDNYTHYDDNAIHLSAADPVSTFGIDVDTASWTNVRRMIEHGRLPPAAAVRAEEFINYFDYHYPVPTSRTTPFSVTTEVAPAPWNAQRQLLLVGIQGYKVPTADLPDANLVFLIDTSGSMHSQDKLPLLQASLRQIVPQLDARDHVAIVTYAGQAGVALPSTPGNEHARILAAIDSLHANGSTNGQAGLELAYAQAAKGYIKDGINRVILATDGDFNVGQTNIKTLTHEIADERRSGIALTTLGVGRGNYNDALAMALADAGNGNHYYIGNLSEAHRVLDKELSSTLMTIAKDVKIQVEFNPARVASWRLIGYVKRKLSRADFNNDRVDSGDLGAGANVTALYEITPTGTANAPIDPLRYARAKPASTTRHGNELAWLRLRYKLPGHHHSQLIERPVTVAEEHAHASARLRFAAAVAAFAQKLRGGKHLDGYTFQQIATLARGARGRDPEGLRVGFVQLVDLAGSLRAPTPIALHDNASKR